MATENEDAFMWSEKKQTNKRTNTNKRRTTQSAMFCFALGETGLDKIAHVFRRSHFNHLNYSVCSPVFKHTSNPFAVSLSSLINLFKENKNIK